MTVALARRLVWEGLVSPDEVNRALYSHVTRRVAFLHALVRIHPDLLDRLEAELVSPKSNDAPKSFAPDRALASALPDGLSRALLVVPIGKNPSTGAVRVIAADAADHHAASEIAYHLGALVEVVAVPLRAVLEALGESMSGETRSSTRAYGSVVPEAPAPVQPTTQSGPGTPAPVQPTTQSGPATPAFSPTPITAPKGSSERPIPLVRVSPEAPRAPQTIKGVAPQGVRSGFPAPIVVPPRSPDAVIAEPVIALTRTRSIGSSPRSAPVPSSPRSSAEPSSPHSTSPLYPVASSARPPSPSTPEPSAPRSNTALLQLGKETPASSPSAPSPSEDFGVATSPDEVAALLVLGLSRIAGRALVFAVRGKAYEGRESTEAADRESFKKLVISADRPSVLSTAVQAGKYFGPIPETAVHEELSHFLGDSTGEIAVGSVVVSGRATLLYALAEMRTAYLATRRGAELAENAGRALERIVRGRKK